MKSKYLALTAFCICLSVPALAAKKALIIANNDYKTPISALTQAIKDGEKINQSLEKIGFDKVIFVQNQTLEQTQKSIQTFAEDLDKKNDIAFVYVAGHGENEEKDYFLPVDFSFTNTGKDIVFKAIAIDELANKISSHARHSIFVVDISRSASRDRKRAVEVPPKVVFVDAVTLGGKRLSGYNSNFTLYSTTLNNHASENSKFAEIVAAELLKPQSVEQLRLNVLQQMKSEENNLQQLPSAINQLDEEVFLADSPKK